MKTAPPDESPVHVDIDVHLVPDHKAQVSSYVLTSSQLLYKSPHHRWPESLLILPPCPIGLDHLTGGRLLRGLNQTHRLIPDEEFRPVIKRHLDLLSASTSLMTTPISKLSPDEQSCIEYLSLLVIPWQTMILKSPFSKSLWSYLRQCLTTSQTPKLLLVEHPSWQRHLPEGIPHLKHKITNPSGNHESKV